MVQLDERRIGVDAITSEHVKDLEVKTGDIANLGVTAAKIAAGAVTKAKIGYKSVAITVAADATSGSSAADSELVGGEIMGYYSTGNQDQLVDNVVLGANGAITITLAAAATADNTFKVVCMVL